MRARRRYGLTAKLLAGRLAVAVALLAPAQAIAATTPVLAHVAYVLHGLSLQTPHGRPHAARVGAQVFGGNLASTQSGQKASFRFGDGTALHLNQLTTVVFRSVSETDLTHGEIAQYLTPGTRHRVVTAAATASAVGTTIDIYLHGDDSTFVVLEGALLVANARGSVVVKTNQETTLGPGEKPPPPTPVNAAAVFDWTTSIPTPVLGRNVALDANGGRAIGASSQAGRAWRASYIDDGELGTGWASAGGTVAGQSIVLALSGGRPSRVSGVLIDPAATNGDPLSEDLKHFQILVSSSGVVPRDFHPVFSGMCSQSPTLQRFEFPASVVAKYVELLVQDNYGSGRRVTVAELEVVATAPGFNDPQGMALDSLGSLYVADTGNDRVVKVSPQGKTLAVWGSRGTGAGRFLTPTGIALDRNEHIFVADSGNHRIDEFSAPGQLLRSWGPGSGLVTPAVVAAVGGRVYVGDLAGHRIAVYDADGNRRAVWPIAHAAPGHCGSPAALAAGANGTVWDGFYAVGGPSRYVLWLEKRAANGRVIGAWEMATTSPACLASGVAVDAHGRAWVTLPGSNLVERFPPSGGAPSLWGGTGSKPGRFLSPAGIGIGRQGAVWVVDSGNDRIQKLTPSGRPLAQLG